MEVASRGSSSGGEDDNGAPIRRRRRRRRKRPLSMVGNVGRGVCCLDSRWFGPFGVGGGAKTSAATFPFHLRRRAVFHRLLWMLMGGGVLALVITTPRTYAMEMNLVTKREEIVWSRLCWLWVSLAFTFIFFLAVQGSDPGYSFPITSNGNGDDNVDAEVGLLAGGGDESSSGAAAVTLSTFDEAFDAFGDSDEEDDEQEDFDHDDLLGTEDVRLDFDPSDAADERAMSGASVSRLPLRAKLCRHSKRVVPTFDHFCTFLGTCIGERNRCRFWWFLLFQSASFAQGLGIIHSGFHDTKAEVGIWVSYNGHAIAAAVIVWILFLSVGGLFLLHTFLAVSNMTSYEFMRSNKVWYLKEKATRDFDLPFSRGLAWNLKFFFFFGMPWYSRDDGRDPDEDYAWPEIAPIERESENVWEHLWENKYWSCC